MGGIGGDGGDDHFQGTFRKVFVKFSKHQRDPTQSCGDSTILQKKRDFKQILFT